MKKRGSHVGAMLSFVIFVTFLIFTYTSLQPAIKNKENLYNNLDRIEANILDLLEEEMSIAIVNAENGCVEVSDRAIYGNYSLVKNDENKILNSTIISKNLVVNFDKNDFFKIYSSNGTLASSENPNCELGNSDNGTISSVQSNNYVFWNRVEDFFERYENDYDNLRDEIGVSPNNFGFGIDYRNGSDIREIGLSGTNKNVFVRETSREYVNQTADNYLVTLRIKIW
jgi:hypothetical protein